MLDTAPPPIPTSLPDLGTCFRDGTAADPGNASAVAARAGDLPDTRGIARLEEDLARLDAERGDLAAQAKAALWREVACRQAARRAAPGTGLARRLALRADLAARALDRATAHQSQIELDCAALRAALALLQAAP